jgi:peptidoglycan/LPS O-acetylase OafA/YrhL
MRSARTFSDLYDRRLNNFDFLRFALAAAVIWSHCYALRGLMDPVFAFTRQIDAGSLAVDGFFVLSGFLITQSWESDPTIRTFALKRALRLVPALLMAQAFGALIVGLIMTRSTTADYLGAPSPWLHFTGILFHRHLASPLLFESNPVPHQLNASLWSLRYEIFCYGLVAVLGASSAGRWSRLAPALMAGGLAGQTLLGWIGAPVLGIPFTALRLVACFFAGSALYALRRQVPCRTDLAALAVVVLLVASLCGGLRIVFPIAGAYLLLWVACCPWLRLQRFGARGDFSYGLYVFAYPIQQSLVQIGTLQLPLFFAVSFGATLALAALSWRFVEAPALALKPRAPSTRPRVPAPVTAASSDGDACFGGQARKDPDLWPPCVTQ